MLNNEVNVARAESRLTATGVPAVDDEPTTNVGVVNGENKSRLGTTREVGSGSSNSRLGGNPLRNDHTRPFEYKNGRKVEQLMYSYETYFKHKEKIPKQYYPLVQYLENVEVKYHNDNLFEDSPLGFPTRAQ